MDLDETLALQKFAEETPDPSLQLEHCLVRLCLLNTVNKRSQNVDVLTYPKVDNAVVYPCVEENTLVLRFLIGLLDLFGTIRVLNGERKLSV